MRARLLLFAGLFAFLPLLIAHGQQKDKPKWAANPNVAATDPLRPEEQRKKFHLPPGFEIQLVAADPDIRKPINIAFDAAGRLWVTETVEYPFAAPEGKGRDAVKVLEDFGPDGRARKITTFAGGLNIPIGVLPIGKGQTLVYSIPSIQRLTDTDGDGKADRREVLYSGYGHKDTHGMTGEFTPGFDGWVYACHGFSNTSDVKAAKGNTAITMQSGNTYRFKTDGSALEYYTHGQVNPFGLTFDPLGNLYSADCHTRPMYQLLRGGYYPSFGKPHDGLGYAPEMVTHDHGSTAISGIVYYAADQYPPEYRDNLYVGNVVTNRINRDRLERHGSTYRGIEMPDFLKCDDPWFRPCDIKLGPDGCLYVADFYNRIIGHYEVPLDHPGRDRDKGRIWRIVYPGPDGKSGPRPVVDLTKATPAELVEALGHPNLVVRMQATTQLATSQSPGIELVEAVARKGSGIAKAQALWVLARRGKLDKATLEAAAKDADPLVRTHVMRILTERSRIADQGRDLALVGLKDADAFVVRCAAEALATHPDVGNINPLLAVLHAVPPQDTHLKYAVRLALRDQLKTDDIWDRLPAAEWKEQDYRAIADVCLGVHDRGSAEFLKTYLTKFDERGERFQRLCHYITRYGQDGAGAWVLELARKKFADDLGVRGATLKTVQQASQERGVALGAAERKGAEGLVNALLAATKNVQVQTGIELAEALKLTAAGPALLKLAQAPKLAEPQRKAAIAALVHLDAARALPALTGILLSDKEHVAVREQVATALASTNLPPAYAALVKAMQSAPARLQSTIALGLASSPRGGEALLQAVETGKASPRLLQDRAIETKLKQAKVAHLEQRRQRLTAGLPPADQQLNDALAKRRAAFFASKSDPVKGRQVFEKTCAACHQIASQGAKIGPQLDGIGIRGIDRLLEDILDPHRNVDQAFRSTVLVLDNGLQMSGLVLREEGEVLLLADAQGKEVRVPKARVQERQVAPLSPMPSNFGEQIGTDDFNDLLAYLLAQRAKE